MKEEVYFLNLIVPLDLKDPPKWYSMRIQQQMQGPYVISWSVLLHYFDENTEAFSTHNNAINNGGAMDLYGNTDINFKGNSSVEFANNMAVREGGACVWFSNVTFADNATIEFNTNTAPYGGAVALLDDYNAAFQTAKIVFTNNEETCGGAIACEYIDGGRLSFDFERVGVLRFCNNTASIWGNPILIDQIPEICNKSRLSVCIALQGVTYMDELQSELMQHITTAPYNIILQTISGYVYDFLDNLIPRETQIDVQIKVAI